MSRGRGQGPDRGETGRDKRATPLGSIAVGVLVLGVALLASGYEVYLRWHSQGAPVDPAVARRIQALERMKAIRDTLGQQARALLPFTRQVEARMIFDDLVGKSALLTGDDLKGLDQAGEAFGQGLRQPGRKFQVRAAQAYVDECRRIADRH